jgi:hypothetical protein
MTDKELAEEIIYRLNTLLQDGYPYVGKLIGRLIELRASIPESLENHPTIQHSDRRVGFLGMLNGVVGVVPTGTRQGWGLIAADMEEDGRVRAFMLTDSPPTPEELAARLIEGDECSQCDCYVEKKEGKV